jgi:hypothetical protein
MMLWQKQPSATDMLGPSFAAALMEGVSIVSATVTTRDAVGTDTTSAMTPGPVEVKGPVVKFALTGGVDGKSYKSTVLATLSDGQVIEGDVHIVIREE